MCTAASLEKLMLWAFVLHILYISESTFRLNQNDLTTMPGNIITSKARRPKNGWFLFSTKVGEIYEISLGYKNSKGVAGPYSTSKHNALVKVPYGPPTNCHYKCRKGDDGEIIGEFVFKNSKRISAGCNESLFNNLEKDVNPFSQRIISLVVSGKKVLLANYFSATQCSKDFIHHNENYDDDGLFIGALGAYDKSTVTIEEIQGNEGSLAGLQEFTELAKKCATFGDSTKEALAEVFKSGGKRNSENQGNKPIKMSKKDTIVNNEKAELEDPEGLESKFKSLYMGIVWIPIDNISISKDLNIVPNIFRVNMIAESIKRKYDPSQAVIVVAPVDDGCKGLDIANPISTQKFFVIQKIHTFSAFQKLDNSGDLRKLHGHSERKLLCFVVHTNSLAMMRYGNIRGNDISSQFNARRTYPQDLLHVHETLAVKDNPHNSLKVVERMARLGRVGPTEETALRKLCKWKKNSFSCLMAVVKAYEAYETLDVKAKGNAGNVSRGERHNILNRVFINLGKVDENYFEANYLKVIGKEISLETLVDQYQKVKAIEKVYAALSQISGYISVDMLKKTYEGKFDDEVLSKFIGAEVNGEKRNKKALLLENYYKRVTSNTSEATPVELIKIQSLDDLKVEAAFDNSDAIVLILKNPQNQSVLLLRIVDNILQSRKASHLGLIIFPTELSRFELLSVVRAQSPTVLNNLQIIPLSFLHESAVSTNGVQENLKCGLLFGKFSFHCSQFKVFYNSIKCLKAIVESVVEPFAEIALVAEPNIPLVEIHTEKFDKKVKYFGSSEAIDKFEQMLNSDKCMFAGNVGENITAEKSSSSSGHDSCITYGQEKQTIAATNNNIESSTSPYKIVSAAVNSVNKNKIVKNMVKEPCYTKRLDTIASSIDPDYFKLDE